MCDVPSLSDKTCAAEYYRQSNCEEEKCVSSYFRVGIFAKKFDFFILRKRKYDEINVNADIGWGIMIVIRATLELLLLHLSCNFV